MPTLNPTAYTAGAFSTNTSSITGVVRAAGEAIVLIVLISGSATQVGSSATWDVGGDNQPMTLLASQLHNMGEARRTEVWYLAAPTSAKTGTISLTYSNTTSTHKTHMARLVSGHNPASFIRNFVQGNSGSTITGVGIGIDITGTDGDLMLLCSAIRDDMSTINPGTTSNYAEVAGEAASRTVMSGSMVGVNGTMSPRFSRVAGITVTYDNASIAMMIQPAAGDVTAPVLTSPTGASTGSSTASGTVSTDEANGTLYRYASTNATETAATIKAAALTQAVSAIGVQNVTFSGLAPSTVYYAHYVHRDAAGNDSAAVHSSSFTTSAAGDTTPPVLTSPTGTKTGSTTASGTVTTDEGNGTLYRLASTNASETAATVKAANLTTVVSSAGVQNVTFTGLAASTTYYVHYVHRDAAGNDSLVSSSASFVTDPPPDTTAPTLSAATATATGDTTASGSVTTNEANGTLYRYVSTNASESAATVKAAALTQAVSGVGSQAVNFTGLSSGTTYYAHYVHRDAAGNDSAVASSASFTTTGGVVGTIPVLPLTRNSGPRGGLWRNATGITIYVHSLAGALVATKTGMSTDSAGMLTTGLSDVAFVPGTSYRYTIVMPGGALGLGQGTAQA